MKDKLLITVAAAALFAGSSIALAQGKPPATGGAQMNPPPATGGAQMNAPPADGGAQMNAPPASKDAVEPGRADTGSKPMTSERPAAADESKKRPATAEDSKRKPPATAQGSQEGKPSATAQTNVNVNLSADQRTKIHSTVIREKNAPRVANVNFKLSVGTVVPRTVHVVAVPASILEIQPAWRGFMYFLVGDQVVIVEPGTLRIVAVIAA